MNKIYKDPDILQNLVSENKENDEVIKLIDKLFETNNLSDEEFLYLLENISQTEYPYLNKKGSETRFKYYKDEVYVRGLIEFSNICDKGCLYCGISTQNKVVNRYRLTKEDILACCENGYNLDFRTFVLQGGEDPAFTDEIMLDIVQEIKKRWPDTRLTLSLGERSKESYKKFFDAGADRYLLRHETADKKLYEIVHPEYMSYDNRIQCLNDLKDIGYQTGTGFLVGLPEQTNNSLLQDIRFIQKLDPEMCGIGPFIPHSETVLGDCEGGTLMQTLAMVSIIRMVCPRTLMPSTTALGTLDKLGREKAIDAGANVVMPNLSPTDSRKLYQLYENKICLEDTADKCRYCIEGRMNRFGYNLNMEKGDYNGWDGK